MKRIYLTLASVAALSMSAFAQPQVDLEAVIDIRTEGITISPGEQLDTSKILCGIFFHGPGDIYNTDDYVFYMTSFSKPGAEPGSFFMDGIAWNEDIIYNGDPILLYVFPNEPQRGQGHVAPYTLAADSINLLVDWEVWNLQDSIVLAEKPYVPGKEYGFYFRAVRVGDINANPVAEDPTPRNNIAIERIIWGEGSSITFAGKEKAEVNLYPNPASNSINFDFNFDAPSHAQVAIKDMAGRIVKVQKFGRAFPGTQKYTVDVSDLNAGIYTLEFNTDEAKAVSKFTISK